MLLRHALLAVTLLASAGFALRGMEVAAAESREVAAALSPSPAAPLDETPRPGLKEYDLGRKNLALGGYDPTSYFADFGSQPKEGSKKITADHRGVLYRFVSEASKKAFLADPGRYEPMYGGWCAWAIAKKKPHKVEPTPTCFTIEGGRLFLFYNGFWDNTKKKWVSGGSAPKLKNRADANWTAMSGEAVRADVPPKPQPQPQPKPQPQPRPKQDPKATSNS